MPMAVNTAPAAEIREARHAFRALNLMVGVAALCWLLFFTTVGIAEKGTANPLVSTALMCGVIVTPLVLALGSYRLARSIGDPALLWAVLSLLGCVGVLCVVALCNRTTNWFKKQGLDVNLLGPTDESLAALENA